MATCRGLKSICALLMVSSLFTAALSSPTATANEDDVEYVSGPIEIVFSFDTTGSMYSVLRQVREVVSEMIHRLQSDIPGIRMGVIAHGDYQDQYCTKHIDLTSDAEKLKTFVMEVDATGGGDAPEAYEEVLRLTASEFSWTPGSQRSLVLIGDASPHEPNYPRNTRRTDWRQESRRLANMEIKVYSIKALQRSTEFFYSTVASIAGGYYLHLNDFDNIFDFIMAISYREYGIEYLQAYEEEVETRLGSVPQELQRLFDTLKQTAGQGKKTPSGKQVKRIPWQPPSTLPPATVIPKVPKHMDVRLLNIRSDIAYRFATTNITTRLANRDTNAQEAIFKVQLPKAAFISNFSMFINGKEYPGEVKEKHQAKVKYDKAKQKGETAAHITAVPRNTNSFKVAVNVAEGEKVTFVLLYQELLERRLGIYEHAIQVDPGQTVEDFVIEVNIHESRDINHLRVPPIRNDIMNMATAQEDNPLVSIERESPNKAQIVFRPTIEEQEAMSEEGVRGQFIVQYDVTRTKDAGEIEVIDGYFVHFFAPEGLPPTNKNVMFVLDMSGSMHGTKMRQLKDAMNTILGQLQPGDYFDVMGFSSLFRYWDQHKLRSATEENIADAKDWVENMISIGATHISGALEKGLGLLNAHYNQRSLKTGATMLVFLTDGQPTVGERDPDKILELVRTQMNPNNFTIFSLGFGNDIDFPFLKALSSQSQGFARRIYADSDAALQLQDFYREIASPVLSDIKVNYLGPAVNASSLTKTSFKHFFNGTEIAICGNWFDEFGQTPMLRAEVSAMYGDGRWKNTLMINVDEKDHNKPLAKNDDKKPSAKGIVNNMERLWAYLTIKQLLDQVLQTPDKHQKEELRQKALELSLKYHFVTSVTSMVVTKPDEEDAEQGIDDPDEKRPEKAEKKAKASKPSSGLKGDPGREHFRPGGSRYGASIPYETHAKGEPGISHFRPELMGLPGLPGFPEPGAAAPYGPHLVPSSPELEYDLIDEPHGPVIEERPTKIKNIRPPVRRRPSHRRRLSKTPSHWRKLSKRPPTTRRTIMTTTTPTTTTTPGHSLSLGGTVNEDPQLAVHVKGSSNPVCFDASGRPGDIIQLLHDPSLNLTVNAILIGRPYMVVSERPKTFIGTISIVHQSLEHVRITPSKVTVDENTKMWEGEGKWRAKAGDLHVSLEFSRRSKNKKTVKIMLGRNNVQFRVARQLVDATTATEALGRVDHLLFYIKRDKGLSKLSDGLMGQFKKMRISVPREKTDDATDIRFQDSRPSRGSFRASAKSHTDAVPGVKMPCWQVTPGWSMLRGTIEDYVVPKVQYSGLAPGLQHLNTREAAVTKSPRRLRSGHRRKHRSRKGPHKISI